LVEDRDGSWLLFFTGVREELRQIGIARGDSPFGPWEAESEPVVAPGPAGAFDAAGALAPFVVIEGDRMRMWYLGVGDPEDFAIGYAEGVTTR
jgi:hypothetical protein